MIGFNGGLIGKTNEPFTETISDDPNYSSVSLLLNGNGTNGSTTFTDSSSYGHTVTANGNAQISTAQSKFGGSSMYFDGSGDYLTVPASSAFDVGSEDFTAELWFYVNANPGNLSGTYRRVLVGNYANATSGWSVQLSGTSTDYTSIVLFDGNTEVVTASQAVTKNTWHHVAFTKSGSNVKLFFNGSQIGSTATRSTFFTSSTRTLYIGRLSVRPEWDFPGYIDDLRITKGVARYTSNFTPPTTQLPGEETGTFVSGVWTLREQCDAVRREVWPQ